MPNNPTDAMIDKVIEQLIVSYQTVSRANMANRYCVAVTANVSRTPRHSNAIHCVLTDIARHRHLMWRCRIDSNGDVIRTA